MEFNKKTITIIVALILVIIILFIFLNQTPQVNQKINYSSFSLEKTINFGPERTEIYTSEIFDPIIIFLIVPKQLTQSATDIKIEGDYQATILKEDPVLMLQQNTLIPGKKKLIIKMPNKNDKYTTILFALPLSEFNELSQEDKEEIKLMMINSSENQEGNFTIENSLKVMQNFANSQSEAGFNKKIENNETNKINLSNTRVTKANFAEDAPEINYEDIANNLNNSFVLQGSTPSQNQTKETTGKKGLNESVELSLAKSFIYSEEENNSEENTEDSNSAITIKFTGEEEKSDIPTEIVLSYSKQSNFIIWNGEIVKEEEVEIETDKSLSITGAKNITLEQIRITESDESKRRPKYLISITIDTTNYESEYIEEEIILTHTNLFPQNEKKIKITLIKNPCTEILNDYTFISNKEQANNTKDYLIKKSISCLFVKSLEENVKIAQNGIDFNEDTSLSREIIMKSISNDPSSYKKLIEEQNTRINQDYNNYIESKKQLDELINQQISIIEENEGKISYLESKANSEEIAKYAKDWKMYLIVQRKKLDLIKDPSDLKKFKEAFDADFNYLKQKGNSINFDDPSEVEKLKKTLLAKYNAEYGGTSQKFDEKVLINSQIMELKLDIDSIELQFGSLLINSIKNCGDGLDIEQMTNGAYDPESVYYDTPRNKIFRNLAKNLLIKEIYYDKENIEAAIQMDILDYRKYTNCEIDLNEFYDPQPGNKVVESLKKAGNFLWIPFVENPERARAEFNAQRDALIEEMKTKTKERAGLILISQREFPNPNESEKNPFKFNDGNTIYDNSKINFKQPKDNNFGDSLLYIYSSLENSEKIKSWFYENGNFEEIEIAKDNLKAAFSGPLKNEIDTIKHFLFRPFTNTMEKAEKLQSELILIDSAINAERLIINNAIQKEKEKTINYVLYDSITGAFTSDESTQQNYNTIKGLVEVKERLLLGENFNEIREDNEEQIRVLGITEQYSNIKNNSTEQGYTDYTKQYQATSNTSNVNMIGSVSTNIGNNYNNGSINQQTLTEKTKEKAQNILLAINNPIIDAEIQSENIFETNGKITEKEKGELALKIGQYYYDNSLWDLATEQYATIAVTSKDNEIVKKAENQLGYLGRSWNFKFLLGRRYRQSFGKVTRELTSLQAIASYAFFYGATKTVAYAAGVGTSTQQGTKAARMTYKSLLEGIESPNSIKSGINQIGNTKIGVEGQLTGKVSLARKINIGAKSMAKSTWEFLKKPRFVLEDPAAKIKFQQAFEKEIREISGLFLDSHSVMLQSPTQANINKMRQILTELSSKGVITQQRTMYGLSMLDDLEASGRVSTAVVTTESTTMTTEAVQVINNRGLSLIESKRFLGASEVALRNASIDSTIASLVPATGVGISQIGGVTKAIDGYKEYAYALESYNEIDNEITILQNELKTAGANSTKGKALIEEIENLNIKKLNQLPSIEPNTPISIHCSYCSFKAKFSGNQSLSVDELSVSSYPTTSTVSVKGTNTIFLDKLLIDGVPAKTLKINQMLVPEFEEGFVVFSVSKEGKDAIALNIISKEPIEVGISEIEKMRLNIKQHYEQIPPTFAEENVALLKQKLGVNDPKLIINEIGNPNVTTGTEIVGTKEFKTVKKIEQLDEKTIREVTLRLENEKVIRSKETIRVNPSEGEPTIITEQFIYYDGSGTRITTTKEISPTKDSVKIIESGSSNGTTSSSKITKFSQKDGKTIQTQYSSEVYPDGRETVIGTTRQEYPELITSDQILTDPLYQTDITNRTDLQRLSTQNERYDLSRIKNSDGTITEKKMIFDAKGALKSSEQIMYTAEGLELERINLLEGTTQELTSIKIVKSTDCVNGCTVPLKTNPTSNKIQVGVTKNPSELVSANGSVNFSKVEEIIIRPTQQKPIYEMTQDEYANWLVGSKVPDEQLYPYLTRRAELRGMEPNEFREYKNSQGATKAAKELDAAHWKNYHDLEAYSKAGRLERIVPYGDQKWLRYKINDGSLRGIEEIHKGYLTFNDPLDLTPEELNKFIDSLAKSNFNGQVKIPDSVESLYGRFDNVVIHGATPDDVLIAKRIAEAQFGKKILPFKQGIDQGNIFSHTEKLAENIKAARAAKQAEAASQIKLDLPNYNRMYSNELASVAKSKGLGSFKDDKELIQALVKKDLTDTGIIEGEKYIFESIRGNPREVTFKGFGTTGIRVLDSTGKEFRYYYDQLAKVRPSNAFAGNKKLNFTCNSLCKFGESEGVSVKLFQENASFVVFNDTAKIDSIRLTGDFKKEYLEGLLLVKYDSAKIAQDGIKALVTEQIGLPNINESAMLFLEDSLKQGKTVGLVSYYEGTQQVSFYAPNNTTAMITPEQIIGEEMVQGWENFPENSKVIYDTTNPNYSVLTHAEENIGWIEARKTKPLVAIELTEDTTIQTLEGSLQAKQGQMLCYGVAGEPWPQDKAALLKKYDVLSSDSPLLTEEQKNILAQTPNAVAYSPKPDRSVMVAQLDTDAQVQASWGVLNAKKGDYLVKPAEDALSTNPQDVWVVDKTLFERTYNIVGEANIPSTQNQIEVFTLGNERSGVVGTTTLNDGEYLIIGNGSGDFRINANPLENTAATSEVVISQNNLLILSGNKLKISNENGKLFLEDIGSVEIAVESNGVFVPIQKNTPIEITPSTRIKATHKFVNQEFIFSLNNMPEYHYFSNKDYAGVDSKIYSVEKKNFSN